MAIAEAAADATKTGNEDWSLNHLHMPQKKTVVPEKSGIAVFSYKGKMQQ